MMRFFVTLTYPTCTDDTDTMIEKIDNLGRFYHSAFWDARNNITEVKIVLSASSPIQALTTAVYQLAPVTALIGVEPDSALVLSTREHTRRYGGPEAATRVERLLSKAPGSA